MVLVGQPVRSQCRARGAVSSVPLNTSVPRCCLAASLVTRPTCGPSVVCFIRWSLACLLFKASRNFSSFKKSKSWSTRSTKDLMSTQRTSSGNSSQSSHSPVSAQTTEHATPLSEGIPSSKAWTSTPCQTRRRQQFPNSSRKKAGPTHVGRGTQTWSPDQAESQSY